MIRQRGRQGLIENSAILTQKPKGSAKRPDPCLTSPLLPINSLLITSFLSAPNLNLPLELDQIVDLLERPTVQAFGPLDAFHHQVVFAAFVANVLPTRVFKKPFTSVVGHPA